MKKIFFFLFIVFNNNIYSQIIIDNEAPYNSATYLIDNVLLGGGIVALLDGQLIPGSKIILDMLGIEKKIIDSDLVITGEGQTDFQTIFDKAPISVSKIAKSLSIPCIAISGSLGEGFESVYAEGIGSISSILNKPMNFDEAIIHSEDLITSATEQAMKYLKIGKKLNID